jgi:hypothetical protein
MPTMTHEEYMRFFAKWLHYQFDRAEDALHNARIITTVSRIVEDDDDLQHWANRDCWSMHDLAIKQLTSKAIKGVTA